MASISTSSAEARDGVLLLGASGRLGTLVRRGWPEDGDLQPQTRTPDRGSLLCDPLAAPEKFADMMQGARAVLCLAGVTPAYAARHGTPLSVNAEIARACVEAAARAQAGRVFLASSAAVYGAPSAPVGEDAACAPLSEYGAAKLEMEREALALAREVGQPVTILRIGNVAGADAILQGWHPDMRIDQFEDGRTPRRSYIGPLSLARVLHRLSRLNDLPEVLNIAAPGAVAMGDLLDAAGLPWQPRPAQAGALPHIELQTKRLEEHVGFVSDAGGCAALVAEWSALGGQ